MPDFLSQSPSRVILDRLKFAYQTRIGPSVRQSMTLEAVEDVVTRQLIARLSAEVLADKLVGDTIATTYSVRQPATWFDWLKQDVWYTDLDNDRIMRWVERKWPVKYKTVTYHVSVKFDRYALYPEARIALPELGRPVIFEQWGQPDWMEE